MFKHYKTRDRAVRTWQSVVSRVTCFILIASFLFLPACGSRGREEPPLSVQGASRASVSSGGIPNFTALQEEDSRTCAWLYIPDTSVSFPVLSLTPEETSIETTLRLDSTRNTPTCTDPVIVLTGNPLHALQSLFLTEKGLTSHPELKLYTPDGILTYRTFACGAYSNKDILRNFLSFKNTENIPIFVNQFLSYHTMMRLADESVTITSTDRLLVLSHPLASDETQNFLVLASLTP